MRLVRLAALIVPVLFAGQAWAQIPDPVFTYVQVDRLEYQAKSGDDAVVWDAQGWVGKDLNKFWFKTEGEQVIDGGLEEFELQGLYSRAVSRYWDLQVGVRHDFDPDPSRTHAVIGFQGLAPYWFEVDAAMFISDSGDVTARIEAEYEISITQRLIAQPRVELNFAFQDDPVLGIGSGLSTVEAGLRIRYEIKREFAPYIGVSWSRSIGDTADFLRADGEGVGWVSFVTGIRMWF